MMLTRLLIVLFAGTSAALAADRALLIGINDYVDTRIRDLRGCENDAEAIRTTLIDDYGFDAAAIRTLRSREATREAVLNAIRTWLIDGTDVGDRVVFFYAGHGSQIANDGGDDEDDGQDEILCPADYDARTQANHIRDDKLNELLRQLDGRNVIVIVDACHSGSVTRSIGSRQVQDVEAIDTGQAVPRYIPPPDHGTRDIFYTAPKNYAIDEPAAAGQILSTGTAPRNATRDGSVIETRGVNFVALTSCQDSQKSDEIPVRIGGERVRRGAFSWFLVAGLSGAADANADQQVTYEELVEYVNRRCRDSSFGLVQRAELRTRPEFFAQPFLNRTLTSQGLPRVVSVQGDRVTINRGVQHGIDRQSVLVPAARSGETGDVRIAEAEQFLSAGVARNLNLRPGDTLEPRDIFLATEDLAIWLTHDGSQADVVDRLRGTLRQCHGVRLVETAAESNRTIRVSSEGGRYRVALYGQYGAILSSAEYATETDLIEDVARRVVGQVLLQSLSQFERNSRSGTLAMQVEGGGETFVIGRDKVRVRFRSSVDCYVCMVSVDSKGNVYTDLLDEGFRARAGVTYTVPHADEPAWDVFLPAGRDVIFALATPEQVDRSGISTRSIEEDGAQAAAATLLRAVGRKPRQQAAAAPAGVDAGELISVLNSEWGVASVAITSVE